MVVKYTGEILTITREVLELYAQTASRLTRFPWRWKEIFNQTVQIGVGSIPIIAISTAFAGLVVTQEMAWHMDLALQSISMVPGFTGQFIIRELGIAIPALLIVSKVGASITAEVATMKITEQVDALKLLRIDPIDYLVFPRWIAAMISIFCLTIIAIMVTLCFAIAMAMTRFNFSFLEYLNILQHFVKIPDVFAAGVKSIVFGSVIPIISCVYGFRCEGGAEGVGSATTNSVVSSTIAVILLDFVLTYLFSLIL